MSAVVTRFAPSPTGYLHIGGARTALYNWLFARANGGTFLLRIEDTDRERSTPDATRAILDGIAWLGLDYDGDAISQFDGRDRHAAAAADMLARGTAYRCYATQEEIEAFREAARAEGRSTLFRSPWRERDASEAPDAPYVVRLKAPREGDTVVEDAVQGRVTWKNDTMDDLVLLRSDGTPTYMLAVVVDDHDMGVTHVIRGDDHLTNAARQSLIFQALGWDTPVFAHIPLIHGADGKKMSKRHGAVGLEEYRDLGYPAVAMRNYLARLGWSHGDDEFFTDDQARDWFGLDGIGKSAARFDTKKLDNISGQHIRAMSEKDLLSAFLEFIALQNIETPSATKIEILEKSMPELKQRAKTYRDLLESAHFALGDRPFTPDEKAEKTLKSVSIGILDELTTRLQHASWTHDDLDTAMRDFAAERDLKLGEVLQPLRAILTGRSVSPSVFNVMEMIGREETLARIEDARGLVSPQ